MLKKAHTLSLYSFLFLLSSMCLFGQHQNVITLDAPESSDQEHIARQRVEFRPGYSYSASNSIMHAEVDPSLPEDVVYQDMFTDNTFPRVIDESKLVGSTSANFAVSNAGAATYSVPISLPPGTRGMSPNLAINYNSQGGNGQIGRGWNLVGLSSITRERKNIYFDQEVIPVSGSVQDPYALDGNRLVLINGTHGTNNSVYYTHEETFSKITAKGSQGNGPMWFEVKMKNGLTYEYGKTEDSRFLIENSNTVLTWRLNKVIDCHGNYRTYHYKAENREIRLDRIEYTGNDNAGLKPYNMVKFHYDYREDDNTTYAASSAINSTLLLTRIHVTTNGADTYRDYRLKYGFDGLHSYFQELFEYGAQGAQYNSTRFQYGDNPLPYQAFPASAVMSILQSDYVTGDFNGDGKTDIFAAVYQDVYQGNIVFQEHTSYELHIKNDLSSNFTIHDQGSLPQNIFWDKETLAESIKKRDFFDPLEDHFWLAASGFMNTGYIIGQHLSKQSKLGSYDVNGHPNYYSTSFNQDEKQDVLMTHREAVTLGGNEIFRSDKITLFQPQEVNGLIEMTQEDHNNGPDFRWIEPEDNYIIVGDFNGDGQTEYLTIMGQLEPGDPNPPAFAFDHEIRYSSPADNEFNLGFNIVAPLAPIMESPAVWAKAEDINVFDFDGDGDHEIMVVLKHGVLGMGTGSFIFDIKEVNNTMEAHSIYGESYPNENSKIRFGDFNGDGKTDIFTRLGSGDWKIGISDGQTFIQSDFSFVSEPEYDGNSNDLLYDGLLLLSDFDGNGLTDVFFAHDSISDTDPNNFPHQLMDVYYSYGNGFKHWRNDQSIGFYEFQQPAYLGDYNGDGKQEILIRNGTNGEEFIRFNSRAKNHYVEKFMDGTNNTVEVEYESMTYEASNDPMHDKNDDAIYPVIDIEAPIYLVRSVSTSNGLDGTNKVAYRYEGAKSHVEGKGSLGFDKVKTYDLTNGYMNVQSFEIDDTYYERAQESSISSLISGSDLINSSSYENEFIGVGNGRFWKRIKSTSNTNHLQNQWSTSTNTFDADGNVILNVMNLGGIETITTENTMFNASCSWKPNKPELTTVTKKRGVYPDFVQKTKRYYNGFGDVWKSVSFSNNETEAKAVTTTIDSYDDFGNPLSTTISAQGLLSRNSTVEYDRYGRHVRKTYNALGQSSLMTYHPVHCKPVSTKSITGLTNSIIYDGFGRVIETKDPKGNITKTIRAWDINLTGDGSDEDDVDNSLFYIKQEIDGAPDMFTRYDHIGRKRKTSTELLDGQLANVVSTYDLRGNLRTETFPFTTAPPKITTNQYDEFNRLKLSTTTGLSPTSIVYDNSTTGEFTVTTTNPANQTNTATTDASGKRIKASDHGGNIEYTYYSHGKMRNTEVNNKVVVSMIYDQYARQTDLIDVNAGQTNYLYNAFGELTYQQDSKDNITEFFYDVLGREDYRVLEEGTVDYQYVNDGFGLNQIKTITGPDGATKSFVYDEFNRVSQLTEVITGENFTFNYDYDEYDNLTKTKYPSGLELKRVYNSRGFLTKITNLLGNMTYYEANSMNHFGQVTSFDLGNGQTTSMTYDGYGNPDVYMTTGIQNIDFNFDPATGNLSSRNDVLKGKLETFTYDNLNRLETSTIGSTVYTTTYKDNGNIETKSDVSSSNYIYDNITKIHAVKEISNPLSAVPSATQEIIYNSAQQPESITDDDDKSLDFVYGPEFSQRARMDYLEVNAPSIVPELKESRYYLGNFERRKYNFNGSSHSTQDIHYINGNGLNMIIVKENNAYDYHYVYTDYLGSILAITDDLGNPPNYENNFDAWGRNRNPNNLNYTGIPVAPGWLYRGYTGHEHMPYGFHTINMNGRLYDPLIGRMLSVDNYIADEGSTQAYNRYSYVFNNPLKYTDPSGELASGGGGRVELDHFIDWGEPFESADMNGLQGDVLGPDLLAAPPKEYVFVYNTKGELVDVIEISDKGGDDYDVIHHQHGKIPEVGSSSYTEVVIKPFGAFRIGPGQFSNSPATGAVNTVDDPFTAGPGALTKGTVGLLALVSRKSLSSIGYRGRSLGERLFLSESFGITSRKFGSSAANAQGALNQGGRIFKAGWSSGTNSAGQWGYKFRIGIGSTSTNANISRFHMYVPKSFVPNSFGNPSIQVKRSLYNLGTNP